MSNILKINNKDIRTTSNTFIVYAEFEEMPFGTEKFETINEEYIVPWAGKIF